MTFSNWDESIHSELDQISKISKAGQIKEDDLVMESDGRSATITGSSGTYEVSLDECTCPSFVKVYGNRPCKHMYKLAMKLGLFQEPPAKDKKAAAAFKKTIPDEVERFRKLYDAGAIPAEKFVSIAKAIQK